MAHSNALRENRKPMTTYGRNMCNTFFLKFKTFTWNPEIMKCTTGKVLWLLCCHMETCRVLARHVCANIFIYFSAAPSRTSSSGYDVIVSAVHSLVIPPHPHSTQFLRKCTRAVLSLVDGLLHEKVSKKVTYGVATGNCGGQRTIASLAWVYSIESNKNHTWNSCDPRMGVVLCYCIAI
jgi:hypothetical protein